jgi:hypothetical protein
VKTCQPYRLDSDWHTINALPRTSPVPWKRYIGEACPHGRLIAIVDGVYVRTIFDSDFCQGGNGYAYPNFVPKGEIWIDVCVPEEEWPFVTFHECMEVELMKTGKSYDVAHNEVKKAEDDFRRRFAVQYG